MSQDLVDRLRTAADSVPADVPDPAPSIRAGRHRSARRTLALATSMCLVAAGTAWAVTELGSLHGNPRHPVDRATFDPSHVHRITPPYGLGLFVPNGWYDREAVFPDNEFLVVSTTRRALDGAIQGCGQSNEACGTRDIRAGDVGRDDAFVHVWVYNGPGCNCTPAPLPDPLTLRDFEPARSIDGTPVWQVQSNVDDGTLVRAQYWVGPDASASTRSAAEFLAQHLHLPMPRFDPAAAREFRVPYSEDPVPIPDRWTPIAAQSEHFALGLAASTNAAAVSGMVTGCETTGPCSIGRIHEGNLDSTDAFVTVEADYASCPSCRDVPPLPWRIQPETFLPGDEILGNPRRSLQGVGNDGRVYTITYWIGPEAGYETEEAMTFLLESLHLPGPPRTVTPQRYTDPDHKFSIDLPAGWGRADATLTPRLSSPAEIFAAGNYPLRPGGPSARTGR